MGVTRRDISGNAATATRLQASDNGSAPHHAARAWVNFNGAGTVAIRASGNVSSITDNGVGDFTVNFQTAMPDANYARAAWANWPNESAAANVSGSELDAKTASACRIRVVRTSDFVAQDTNEIGVAFFR